MIKEAIVLSPHLDDAVLSMGSILQHLSTAEIPISVINIFTQGSKLQSPKISALLDKAGFSDSLKYFEERKQEDMRAFSKIGGVQVSYLDFTDAAWRKDENDKPLYPSAVVGVYNNQDDALGEQLESTIKTYLTSDDITVFAPLAVGRHVDHILVRNAAAKISSKIIYYMDFPYLQKYPNEEEFIHKHKLKRVEWTMSPFEKKKDAILEYKTQLASLFPEETIDIVNDTIYVPEELRTVL